MHLLCSARPRRSCSTPNPARHHMVSQFFSLLLISSAPDQGPQLSYYATCLSNGRILVRGTTPTAQQKTLPGTSRRGSKSVRRSSRCRIHSLHQSASPALSDGRGINRRVYTSLKVCIPCTVWYGSFTSQYYQMRIENRTSFLSWHAANEVGRNTFVKPCSNSMRGGRSVSPWNI